MAMIVTNEGWMVRPVGGAMASSMARSTVNSIRRALDAFKKLGTFPRENICSAYNFLTSFLKENSGEKKRISLVKLLFNEALTAGATFVLRVAALIMYVHNNPIPEKIEEAKRKYRELGCRTNHREYCEGWLSLWHFNRRNTCDNTERCNQITIELANDRRFWKNLGAVMEIPVLLLFLYRVSTFLSRLCAGTETPEDDEVESFEDDESVPEVTEFQSTPPTLPTIVFETVPPTNDFPYKIEKIVDTRTVNRRNQYFIKWKDYDESNNQWMSYKELQNSLQNPSDANRLINVYNKSRRQNS